MARLILEFLHEIGAAVLLVTGVAVVVLMLTARRAAGARPLWASRAGLAFTVTGFGIEPLTGVVLTRLQGQALTEGWIVISVMLYILAAALWLPAAWVQSRLLALAQEARGAGRVPAAAYRRLHALWFAMALPALAVMAAIGWLMVARPAITLW